MGQEPLTESESPPPGATVQIEGRESGPPIITVTVHAADVADAARLAREQYDALIRRYATGAEVGDAEAPAPVFTPTADLTGSVGLRVTRLAERAWKPAPRLDGQTASDETESTPDQADTDTLSRRDMLVVGAGGALLSVMAWMVLFWYGAQPVVWDARGYYDLAIGLTRTGLGGWNDLFRTYAYPLYVAAFVLILGDNVSTVHAVVALSQCLVNLGVAAAAGWAMGRAFGRRSLALLTFLMIALNPILLIQAVGLLSDSLSASLTCLAVVPLMAVWRVERSTSRLVGMMAASLFCASLSAEIRPTNAVIIPVILVLWAVRAAWFRSPSWHWLALLVVAVMLPLVPQMLGNQRAYGLAHPLIVGSDLYELQVNNGATRLKYATSLVHDKSGQMLYENPFLPPSARTAGEFLRASPVGYLATLGLHGFGLIDHDLPFTYVRELHPPYRWPLSVVNYLFWSLAAVGTVWALRRVVKLRAIEPCTWAIVVPVLVGGAYLAAYLPVAVEARYGAPLFPLAGPMAAIGVVRVWCSVRQDRRRLVLWVAGAVAVVVACASLSAWISQQAPFLRGA